ncbi:hypothetical protein [Larkinella ripae]
MNPLPSRFTVIRFTVFSFRCPAFAGPTFRRADVSVADAFNLKYRILNNEY